MAYDPTNEAIVRDLLAGLDPQETDAGLSYVDVLRRAQSVLIVQEATTPAAQPDPAVETAVLQTLGRLDPHADDVHQDHISRVRRLQSAIDRELSKWTSSMVQPAGPSGDYAVPAPLPAPVE